MTPPIERRCLTASELRAETQNGAPVLVGYAAVFGKLSEDLGGFREVIEPGFFSPCLADDVRALWNHDPGHVLGRTTAGTLSLKEDGRGLLAWIVLPDTATARDLRVSVNRGDVSQMSFGFSVREDGDRWEEQAGGGYLRHLLPGGAAQLYDVSPVTFPAYRETTLQEGRAIMAARLSRGAPPTSRQGPRLDRSFLLTRLHCERPTKRS